MEAGLGGAGRQSQPAGSKGMSHTCSHTRPSLPCPGRGAPSQPCKPHSRAERPPPPQKWEGFPSGTCVLQDLRTAPLLGLCVLLEWEPGPAPLCPAPWGLWGGKAAGGVGVSQTLGPSEKHPAKRQPHPQGSALARKPGRLLRAPRGDGTFWNYTGPPMSHSPHLCPWGHKEVALSSCVTHPPKRTCGVFAGRGREGDPHHKKAGQAGRGRPTVGGEATGTGSLPVASGPAPRRRQWVG